MCRSCARALANTVSRESASMIGAPLAESRANRSSPGSRPAPAGRSGALPRTGSGGHRRCALRRGRRDPPAGKPMRRGRRGSEVRCSIQTWMPSFEAERRSRPQMATEEYEPDVVTAPDAINLSRDQSRARMSIRRTTRSGSGRTRSMERRPFERSAPSTSIPSAKRKTRWNWRAAMPRWRKWRSRSST